MKSIVFGLSLAVAFSWEAAFDISAEVAGAGGAKLLESSETTGNKDPDDYFGVVILTKYIVMVVLCLFIVPGYIMYIVPIRVELSEATEKAEQAEANESKATDGTTAATVIGANDEKPEVDPTIAEHRIIQEV